MTTEPVQDKIREAAEQGFEEGMNEISFTQMAKHTWKEYMKQREGQTWRQIFGHNEVARDPS